MAADDFFSRWSKKNTEARTADERPDAPEASSSIGRMPVTPTAGEQRLPTLEDLAQLTPDADFSAFMARGVDETVKRAAVKKLFSDPHFNVMDGLDVYIDDYNSFEALTPDIVATLNHAKTLLDPLSQYGAPTMNLLDALDDPSQHIESVEQADDKSETATPLADTSAAPPGDADTAAPAEQARDESEHPDPVNDFKRQP